MSSKSGSFWPLAIFSLLFLILIINIAVWNNATRDSSHVVLDDYYNRAVHHDDSVRQDSINVALSWDVHYHFLMPEAAAVDAAGSDYPANTRVAIDLLDAEGQAIRGAAVHFQAFHLAHSASPINVEMQEEASGYSSNLRLGPAGIWHLNLHVEKEGVIFTHRSQKELVAAP